MKKRVAVIGAGVAGLVAATRLAYLGFETVVFEKQATVGGRAEQATWGGFTFDLGPTLLFMLDVFRQAFGSWDADFDKEVPTTRLRPNYRLNFPDGKTLVVSPVLSETLDSIRAIAPGSERGLLPFLAGGARSYELLMNEFVAKPNASIVDFVSPRSLAALVRAGAFRTLARSARRAFGSERIESAFSLQSMYLGMSPFHAPDMYRLLVFNELGQGIFFPHGGIGRLPQVLHRLAEERGARFHLSCPVERVDPKHRSVRVTAQGVSEQFDAVILTADLAYAYASLLGEKHVSARMRHTPSALLMYIGLDRAYADLLHHEFLMPEKLSVTCGDIFQEGRFPRDPAIYLCAPARTDASFAPSGKESLYVLVPAPNLSGSTQWKNETEAIADGVIDAIERRRLPGLRSRMSFLKTRTPADFSGELNLFGGSAFGLSHDLFQIGPFRPSNRHRRFKNVYFAGASTRPATGLPLVTIGAMQTVDRVVADMQHG